MFVEHKKIRNTNCSIYKHDIYKMRLRIGSLTLFIYFSFLNALTRIAMFFGLSNCAFSSV